MREKVLRVGIVGLGIGEQHIYGYENHPSCRVTALCDLSKTKLREVGARHKEASLFTDPEEILAHPEIDIVSIATYDHCHASQTITALKNNKHVFVEKPICLNIEEARTIRSLLKEKRHLRISSNLILRMSPRFQLLKKMILEKTLGSLYYLEGDYNYGRIHKIIGGWRGKDRSYSVVSGGAIHIIDLLLWLTQSEVEEVFAYGNNIVTQEHGFSFPDTVVSLLKFKNDVLAKVAANFGCVFPHYHALAVYGTQATFVNGFEDALLYTSRDPAQVPEKIAAPYPGVRKRDLIHSFVESVLGQSEAEVTEDDIFRTISVCFAIEQSLHAQKREPVRYI